jgi:hypothetical protein
MVELPRSRCSVFWKSGDKLVGKGVFHGKTECKCYSEMRHILK